MGRIALGPDRITAEIATRTDDPSLDQIKRAQHRCMGCATWQNYTGKAPSPTSAAVAYRQGIRHCACVCGTCHHDHLYFLTRAQLLSRTSSRSEVPRRKPALHPHAINNQQHIFSHPYPLSTRFLVPAAPRKAPERVLKTPAKLGCPCSLHACSIIFTLI